MTYDPIDTDDDGVVEADVDNPSTTTDDQTINQSVTYPDGTTVTTSPGGGLWTKDGSDSVTGGSSLTYTIGTSAEAYLVYYEYETASGAGSLVDARVDGDTSTNYDAQFTDGTVTTGSSEWDTIQRAGAGNVTYRGSFYLYEYANRGFGIMNNSGADAVGTKTLIRGVHKNSTPPLSQFTILNDTNNSDNIDVEVYRRDIA